ncbi:MULTISPECIES: universal stress protein [unclassified Streptomyces]|uniref:universal stress protein n=1 Tax=unclassified Streptomyces TaxID=2593676 RepID=UPI00225B478B|nr:MULTISPECIES: universal stress protein [unclassified Streptomyces]MCX4553495.1 universal stress protein [Streptomyces sp. NBC_01500]WSC18450.1 universal stress protein [Streptomyces sp. NBC_01766]WSV52490.1 universal stress protein [Streptomyces sp. NBC_01014]
MELPVVVGVDGSQGSLQAVDWGAAEAERSGRTLRVVHASLWEHYEGVRPGISADRPSEQVFAENLVAAAQERATRLAPGIEVSTDVRAEEPVSALLEEGTEAALLVLGPRGHGPIAGMLLGSVSLAVAARAHCPVVVTRGEPSAGPPKRGRVVLGIGSTTGSTLAARFAFEQARSRGCELVAVRAWSFPPYQNMPYPYVGGDQARTYRQQAEETADRILGVVVGDYPEVAVERKLVAGTAHQMLLEEAVGTDLLVVGARRRHAAIGLQLGRVNHAMLHHAPCPVAVVPEWSGSPYPEHQEAT